MKNEITMNLPGTGVCTPAVLSTRPRIDGTRDAFADTGIHPPGSVMGMI